MPSLDTNVLVRWLVQDDLRQVSQVAALFDASVERADELFVPITVLLETEWVLRSRYGMAPDAVARALDGVLSAPQLEVMNLDAAERALWMFKQDGAPDFADCLHLSLAQERDRLPWLTFEARASRLPGAGRMPRS
jgi:predicted nucleic-acid-binding protein